jgi:hypothetical protein
LKLAVKLLLQEKAIDLEKLIMEMVMVQLVKVKLVDLAEDMVELVVKELLMVCFNQEVRE